MGIYLCQFFFLQEEPEIQQTINKEIQIQKPTKKEKTIQLRFTFKMKDEIKNVAQFHAGNILLLTNVQILLFDNNFNLLTQTKNIYSNDKLNIKDNNIFVVYGERKINIFYIESSIKEKYTIKLLNQIESVNQLKQVEIIEENYLIVVEEDRNYKNEIFAYAKNPSEKYEKLTQNLTFDFLHTFEISRKNKYFIICDNSKIQIYDIYSFKLKAKYDIDDYYNVRASYLFYDDSLGIQMKHPPMTIMKPADILLIYDIKDLKNIYLIANIQLDNYAKGLFNKEKDFIVKSYFLSGTLDFYTFDNLLIRYKEEYKSLYGNKKVEEKYGPKHIKIKKLLYYRFSLPGFILNQNDFYFWDSNELYLYEIIEKII